MPARRAAAATSSERVPNAEAERSRNASNAERAIQPRTARVHSARRRSGCSSGRASAASATMRAGGGGGGIGDVQQLGADVQRCRTGLFVLSCALAGEAIAHAASLRASQARTLSAARGSGSEGASSTT